MTGRLSPAAGPHAPKAIAAVGGARAASRGPKPGTTRRSLDGSVAVAVAIAVAAVAASAFPTRAGAGLLGAVPPSAAVSPQTSNLPTGTETEAPPAQAPEAQAVAAPGLAPATETLPPPPVPPTVSAEPAAPTTPAAPAPGPPAPAPASPIPRPTPPQPKDELSEAGYLPGYRRAKTLGLSAYAPQVGGMPGGVTPAFGAPTPPSDWSFKWSGFLSASLQTSTNRRPRPTDGQSTTVFHVPAQTLDEYASFVGTSTMPGTWAALNFELGGKAIAANFSINTWNPSQPSTYYQVGSQYFINNAFLTFSLPTFIGIAVHVNAGYFYNTYGSVGQYGLGMYQNAVIGSVRGVGETTLAEYAFSPSLSLVVEDGVMGNRTGKAPDRLVANSGNGGTAANPVHPASWVHHLHVGIVKKGDPLLRVQLHYITNFARDDRSQMATDNPVTRQVDEGNIKDGHIDVYGVDASVSSNVWGQLGAAASLTKGENAYLLRGLLSYGGEGVALTDRWWGGPTGGTGTLAVAGVNYSVSLGRIVARPIRFEGDGPDILINAGFIIAKSSTTFEPYDRVRHKYGLDALYKMLPWMAVGIRGDRVVPTSRDSGETFHVISPRLVLRTDWQSRETVTLLYAKWFQGPRSHSEASASGAPDKIDDQLIALNVSMWW